MKLEKLKLKKRHEEYKLQKLIQNGENINLHIQMIASIESHFDSSFVCVIFTDWFDGPLDELKHGA